MSKGKDLILIEEEYGYKQWLWRGDYAIAKERWETMKGLNCLVAVDTIFPGALNIGLDYWCDIKDQKAEPFHSCHVHECDDSWLSGSKYKIPEAEVFEICGKQHPHRLQNM